MLNNYDKIARNYDWLSRLVYSNAQVNAQIDQLPYIPSASSILIVGGGTGWILEEIAKYHAAGLQIVYVEISEKMIELSKQRNCGENKIAFFATGIEHFETLAHFDVVLTPFLFDNFNLERAESVYHKLHHLLKPEGLWFHVDFDLSQQKGKWWRFLLLKSMYVFFKLLKIVEAKKLVMMEPYFQKYQYSVVQRRFYYGKFIQACIFKK